MKRYRIFNSKDEIIHEDYFNDIDEVKEWAKNNEEADYCFEVYLLYDKLVNVLASKGKTIEDIKHVNLLHWYSDGVWIDTDKYLETLKNSYSTGCCDNANIILDNAVVTIRKYYDEEWKVQMEYICLEKGEEE